MKAPDALPELDQLDVTELRALVRAYHNTLISVITDNNNFSAAQEKGNQIWAGQVNTRLAALFNAFNERDRSELQ